MSLRWKLIALVGIAACIYVYTGTHRYSMKVEQNKIFRLDNFTGEIKVTRIQSDSLDYIGTTH